MPVAEKQSVSQSEYSMPIHIQINETTAIGADSMCWMLKRLKRRKNGPQWEPYAYYPTLQGLAKAYVESLVRTSDAQTTAELREAMENAVSRLSLALAPMDYTIQITGNRSPGCPPVNQTQVNRIPAEHGPMSGGNT